MTWSADTRPGEDHYEPLRVVARMQEPIVYYENGMHLDGILAAAAFKDLDYAEREAFPSLSETWALDLDVPLGRWSVAVEEGWDGDPRLLDDRGRLWGWRASDAVAEWALRRVVNVRKRPDVMSMIRYAADKSVDIKSGPLKAYDIEMPSVFAREVEWFAFGDCERVAYLLSRHIRAIGKKRGHGHGVVMSWHVEPVEVDRSVEFDEAPTRRMPVESGLDGWVHRGTIRPPYHHHSRLAQAVAPWA